jgi:hypothetical protein
MLTVHSPAAVAPLSFQQEHIWRGPDPSGHTIPSMVVRVCGDLDASAVSQALNTVVARHASLRTNVEDGPDGPRQVVAERIELPLASVDLAKTATKVEDHVLGIIEGLERPFDPAAEPLVRAAVARVGRSEHVILISAHHLVADLWSTKVLVNELAHAYNALFEPRGAPLAPLSTQYPDYAVWQRQWFSGEVLRDEVEYWRDRIDGMVSLRFEPDGGSAPASAASRTVTMSIADDVTQAVHRASRALRVTPFTFLLAAFYVLAYRRTGHPEFLIDSLIANRDRAELEPMIGMFAGSLLLRAAVSESLSFADLAQRTQSDCLSAYAHQHLPFRKVQEFSRAAVTRPRVSFAFQAAPFRVPRFVNASISAFDTAAASTPTWDQWWQLVRRVNGIDVTVVYAPHLFTAESIRRILAQYISIVRVAISAVDLPVAVLLERTC